jgi:hypothetical protein
MGRGPARASGGNGCLFCPEDLHKFPNRLAISSTAWVRDILWERQATMGSQKVVQPTTKAAAVAATPFPSHRAFFGTAHRGQGHAGCARRRRIFCDFEKILWSEPLTAGTVLEDGAEGKGGQGACAGGLSLRCRIEVPDLDPIDGRLNGSPPVAAFVTTVAEIGAQV